MQLCIENLIYIAVYFILKKTQTYPRVVFFKKKVVISMYPYHFDITVTVSVSCCVSLLRGGRWEWAGQGYELQNPCAALAK